MTITLILNILLLANLVLLVINLICGMKNLRTLRSAQTKADQNWQAIVKLKADLRRAEQERARNVDLLRDLKKDVDSP